MIFFATKKDGELKYDDQIKLNQYIDALPNCRVTIIMKRYRSPRSILQNKLWQGITTIIAHSVGEGGRDGHERVKNGIKFDLGLYRKDGPLKIFLSSADLNTKEYTVLVDRTYQIAAEMNIILPTPEEWDQMDAEERKALLINGGM